jgi:hypothetical protein
MTTNNSVNVGLSGSSGTGSFAGTTSPTFVTPVLGTPTSGTLTTCTGLPISTGISGLGTGVATALGLATIGVSNPALTIAQTNFTPTLTAATPGDLSVAYSTQTGRYITIGELVYFYYLLVCTPTFSTASGALRFDGLPYAPQQSTSFAGISNISAGFTWPSTTTSVSFITTSGQTYLNIYGHKSATASVIFNVTTIVSGVAITVAGSGIYIGSV